MANQLCLTVDCCSGWLLCLGFYWRLFCCLFANVCCSYMVAVHLVSFTFFVQLLVISEHTLMLGQCWWGIAVGGNPHTAGDHTARFCSITLSILLLGDREMVLSIDQFFYSFSRLGQVPQKLTFGSGWGRIFMGQITFLSPANSVRTR